LQLVFFIICISIDEDFGQPMLECPVDLRKLYTLINFDIHKRYEQLLEFFKKHNFVDETKMVETKLNVIKQSMKSSSSNSNREIVKRKRTHNVTTKKDTLTIAIAADKDEEVSQSPAKYLKSH
jgi:hypothetical protein